MIELDSETCNVITHQEAADTDNVGLIHIDAKVKVALPVDCGVVVLPEGRLEVESVTLPGVLHAKVVNYKVEDDGAPCVPSEARSSGALVSSCAP